MFGREKKKKEMCGKQGLSFFSVDTVVPVCEVWSSGSHLVTMRKDVWQRKKTENTWVSGNIIKPRKKLKKPPTLNFLLMGIMTPDCLGPSELDVPLWEAKHASLE